MKVHMNIILIIFLNTLLSSIVFSQANKVTWYSFNMGYGEPKESNTMIKSVAGQVFVGTTQQFNTQIISGFLVDTLFRGTIVNVNNQELLPAMYLLTQNYPNPFNPITVIHFEIPKELQVTLRIYNVLGQEIMNVIDERRIAGRYDIQLDASSLPSGVYFYRLLAGDFISTKKFILLK